MRSGPTFWIILAVAAVVGWLAVRALVGMISADIVGAAGAASAARLAVG